MLQGVNLQKATPARGCDGAVGRARITPFEIANIPRRSIYAYVLVVLDYDTLAQLYSSNDFVNYCTGELFPAAETALMMALRSFIVHLFIITSVVAINSTEV